MDDYTLQEITGLEVTSLIEDPEHASVRQIVSEVLGSRAPGANSDAAGTAAGSGAVAAQHVASPWISPAPITVKMRLFCLPYAGGISENVYSRWRQRNLPPSHQLSIYIRHQLLHTPLHLSTMRIIASKVAPESLAEWVGIMCCGTCTGGRRCCRRPSRCAPSSCQVAAAAAMRRPSTMWPSWPISWQTRCRCRWHFSVLGRLTAKCLEFWIRTQYMTLLLARKYVGEQVALAKRH